MIRSPISTDSPSSLPLTARRATDRDLDDLVRLCAHAVAQRGTLWSTRKAHLDPAAWLAARAPVVVVADSTGAVGFAAARPDGVPLGVAKCAEALAYVMPSHRRRGAARAVMSELTSVARVMGLWKLIAYALPGDAASRALLDRIDFREVGVLVKHAQIDGSWHDVALYERLVLSARKSLPSVNDG